MRTYYAFTLRKRFVGLLSVLLVPCRTPAVTTDGYIVVVPFGDPKRFSRMASLPNLGMASLPNLGNDGGVSDSVWGQHVWQASSTSAMVSLIRVLSFKIRLATTGFPGSGVPMTLTASEAVIYTDHASDNEYHQSGRIFMTYLQALLQTPGTRSFIPLVIMRITIGVFFFASGFNKVFVPESQAMMLETITEAGIPFPAFMAFFVAGCETLFGLLLTAGFLTRLSALVLMIISLVALFTVGLHHIPANLNLLTWYSWLFYLPESAYLVICLLLVVQGGGPLSIDRAVAQRLTLRT